MDNFYAFIKTDPTITKFLGIGLTASEIKSYYISEGGLFENNTPLYVRTQNLKFKESMLKTNPETVAQRLAGQRFPLNKKVSGSIYHHPQTSGATRIFFEMKDSNINAYSVRILDIIGNSKSATTEDIIKRFFEKYKSRDKNNIYRWLPVLSRHGLISNKDGVLSLNSSLQPCYSKEVIEVWKGLKTWKHRRKLYYS